MPNPSVNPDDFVTTGRFTPNTRVNWITIGNIASVQQNGTVFTLSLAQSTLELKISFLSARCFRVRFNPKPDADLPGPDLSVENSYSVVTRSLGAVQLTILENSASALVVDTGQMRVHVDLTPYRIRVFRGQQLINADEPDFNLVYIPGQRVIANFKTFPANARHCGFGEKAGDSVFKGVQTMTQFNFDAFSYAVVPVSSGGGSGPRNASVALYASIPLLIEVNPQPVGAYSGARYSYGIFFDNPAQSYFNLGFNDYGTSMFGKYYFGALFGDMDYYFLLGDRTADVLAQFTTLTGRSAMPPKFVFGFHQGCYGYFDSDRLEKAADGYRNARIPCDGLHIDVDFQDNYRTFTHSNKKFPNCARHARPVTCTRLQMFDERNAAARPASRR